MPQFDTAESAFAWQLSELDGQLRRLSGGETGERLQWFVPLVKQLKQDNKIRSLRDGDWTDYDDVDRLAVRRGTRLTAADIPLQLAEWAREELGVLDAAGTPATAERPLQIGVPCYLDLALFIFGPARMLGQMSVFREAVAAQIDEIVALAGDRVIFQLETPAALIAVASAPKPLRPALAGYLARLVTRQAAQAPEGTRFGVHLCLGDLGHNARTQLPDADPLVKLATALVRRWPQGRTLEFIHFPLSGGEAPPTTDQAFYAPLGTLNRDGFPRLIAGIAHEKQPLADQLAIRATIENQVGRPVDIATACGLGRRTPQQATDAVGRMRELLH
jgi:hypothetical protein